MEILTLIPELPAPIAGILLFLILALLAAVWLGRVGVERVGVFALILASCIACWGVLGFIVSAWIRWS